ncbi:MAG: MraZ N-terminal domain containing protein, partial [Brevundimonas sp.]|nr:MraZ N-terminal domain containing protein [Brevundimonas sp.]
MESARPISYSGQGFSLMGEKGRFVLPPDFRKAVRDSGLGERVLCVTKHPRWKCLTGFGLSRVSEFEAELDREERIALERGHDFDRDARASHRYGFSR